MVLVEVAPEGETNSEETKPEQAIVIFEKKPFSNDSQNWSQVIDGSELRFVVQNDIYGSFDVQVPSELNGMASTFLYHIHFDKKFRILNKMLYNTNRMFMNQCGHFLSQVNMKNVLYGRKSIVI